MAQDDVFCLGDSEASRDCTALVSGLRSRSSQFSDTVIEATFDPACVKRSDFTLCLFRVGEGM
ncbi:MAG: hypothetical protein ACRBM6_38430, partial [Geminicoccales bacterium]